MIKEIIEQRDDEVLMWQPTDIPYKLLNSIGSCLTKYKFIKKAFFTCMQNNNSLDNIIWVIAIDTGDEKVDLLSIDLKESFYKHGKPGIIMQIVDATHEPFASYFRDMPPFYIKSDNKKR